MAQMSSDMEKSSQTFEEHQQAMNDDAMCRRKRTLCIVIKNRNLNKTCKPHMIRNRHCHILMMMVMVMSLDPQLDLFGKSI